MIPQELFRSRLNISFESILEHAPGPVPWEQFLKISDQDLELSFTEGHAAPCWRCDINCSITDFHVTGFIFFFFVGLFKNNGYWSLI